MPTSKDFREARLIEGKIRAIEGKKRVVLEHWAEEMLCPDPSIKYLDSQEEIIHRADNILDTLSNVYRFLPKPETQ